MVLPGAGLLSTVMDFYGFEDGERLRPAIAPSCAFCSWARLTFRHVRDAAAWVNMPPFDGSAVPASVTRSF